MGKIRKIYTRPSAKKDPRLIVIASEGTEVEPRYFNEFISPKYYYNPGVQVEILERSGTKSAPRYIIEQLDKYRRSNGLTAHDELWAVIDKDKWTNNQLNEVAKLCEQNNYKLALSNPCFELWLMLHLRDVTTYDQVQRNKVCSCKDTLKSEIINIARKSYHIDEITNELFLDKVTRAISNAKKLEIDTQARWPTRYGTRIYRLAESLISK